MSAADAFTRATISALSASVRLTGPLADLMYRVLPSTLSIVPATRWRPFTTPVGKVGLRGGDLPIYIAGNSLFQNGNREIFQE
jgi:hypothetical protein